MTEHRHRQHVPGCFRCDLSREEVREYVESTPDTNEIRESFVDAFPAEPRYAVETARFDRWLAARDSKIRAEAWAAGYDKGWADRNSATANGVYPSDTYQEEHANPYRAEGAHT